MTLLRGARLGPYEIVEPLGAGGMGVVYRAHDSRLARDVAVKVVAGHLALDPGALSRFEREAKAIAALTHPNILAIHDIGVAGDQPYAVTELLEGESLRARLVRGPLPWREAVGLALAASDGLAAAHDRGIVHRDLKPENLFLTRDGRLKVLDFGLARQEAAGRPVPAQGDSPTVAATGAAMIVGTVGYLAPEQARGLVATPASDVFALGCVLYEMVAGRPAFEGATAADRLAALLHHDPDGLARGVPDVPSELDAIVQRCLQKEAWRRFPSARELSQSLQTLLSVPGHGSGVQAARRPRSRTRSLAVMPFELAPADSDAEFLSDGLTEAIINRLSAVPKLRVVPRSTVFRYKGLSIDLPAIGRELGATDVLTGRVSIRGDSLKVQVELIESATDRQLWGQHYTRQTPDLVDLQDALAQDITAALKIRLVRRGKASTHATPENGDAYQDFLRGRYFLNQYTPGGFTQAIAAFERAVGRDPLYALAHAELANAIGTARFFGSIPPGERDAQSFTAIMRALELDPELAEAHSARAKRAFFYERDWTTAQAHFERGLALRPDYAECRIFYALLHAALGRPERALAEGRRATDDTPLFGLISAGYAMVQMLCGRIDGGIGQARRALEIDPGNAIALKALWYAYGQLGRYDEALDVLVPLVPALGLPADGVARLRSAYQAGGADAFWREQLRAARDMAARRYVPPHDFLFIYSRLGEIDRVLEYAERCVEINSGILVFMAVDPCFHHLHGDPRFQDLLRRLGLPTQTTTSYQLPATNDQEPEASDQRPKTKDQRPKTKDQSELPMPAGPKGPAYR